MRTKLLLFGSLLIGTSLLVSCNSSGNSTTIINQGIDCGLVRDNLIGTWNISLGLGVPSLQNCSGTAPGLNGTPITTGDFPATYAGVDIFGSDGSSSYKVLADRTDSKNDGLVTDELNGTVQADSCLALVRVWDKTDALYIQCIGTLKITNGTVSGSCDSVEIDSDGIGGLDTSCSLSSTVSFDASIT